MQKTIYQCDQCHREIGRKAHITLRVSTNDHATGIAVPRQTSGWETHYMPMSFIHFHNGKCLGAYFDTLLARAIKKSK